MKDLGIRVWGLGRRGSSKEPMEVRIGNVGLLVRAFRIADAFGVIQASLDRDSADIAVLRPRLDSILCYN